MHEGAYAGIIEPDVHFISVKKDYSNVEEVVRGCATKRSAVAWLKKRVRT